MKKVHFGMFIVLALGFAACNEQEKDGEASSSANRDTGRVAVEQPPAPPMDSAAKMKAWMDYMTPGAAHQVLAGSAGKWKTENTMWMEPGAPAQTSTGEATNTMMFDGRYLRSTHTSVMDGMPFTGEATMAYDNARKVYISSWIDNMGTGVMTLEGPYDEASRTMTLKGKMTDPMSGKECDIREVTKFPDQNTQIMEMYCTQGGKEFKTMELKMTRL